MEATKKKVPNEKSLKIIKHEYKDSKENRRVQYIDIARGIAIILMVIGHSLPLDDTFRSVIFSFHMPLFIIVSGMFYKDKKIKKVLKSIFFKLILPYILCTLIINIMRYNDIRFLKEAIVNWVKQIAFSYSYQGNIRFAKDVYPLSILWFLPLLAIVKLIFIFLKRISKDDKIKLLFCIILTTYIGFLLGIKKYFLPFSLDVAMFCMSFYYIGYILKETKVLEKILTDKVLLIICLIIWIVGIKYNDIEIAIRKYTYGVFAILTAVSGTIIIFKISLVIERYFKKIAKILSWYGKNSLKIMTIHYAENILIEYNKISPNIEDKIIEISAIKIAIVSIGTAIINLIKRGYIILKTKIFEIEENENN